MTAKSATLRINEQMQAFARKGERVVNLGFGEAGLPVLPVLRELVAANSARNAYPPVQGGEGARTAVAGYFTRRGITATPDLCLMAPGSKAILYGLLACLPGDLILARPSWVSYAAQGSALGKQIVWCDAPESAGGIPDPDQLTQVIDEARASGLNPHIMVITSPDNPSGTVASSAQLAALARIAKAQDLVVISDEIYRDLAYDSARYTSIAELIPDQTIVTAGLSKSLALGGWRIGVARFPVTGFGESLYDAFVGLASEVWSGMPIFLESVVEYVFADPEDVTMRIEESRRLHSVVSHAIYDILKDAGASVRAPVGGFYLYPTFAGTEFAKRLAVTNDEMFADALLHKHKIAVLPGTAFGDFPSRLGIRVVTSMLYGATDEERLATLHSANPLSEPSVSDALEQIREAFLCV